MEEGALTSPLVLSSKSFPGKFLRKEIRLSFLRRTDELSFQPTYRSAFSRIHTTITCLNLPSLLVLTAALLLGGVSTGSAQDIKIAVIDMQKALNEYYKTNIEVDKINALADEKRKNLDERQAAYQQMTSQMTELDKTVRDTSLAEAKRKEAMEKLQALVNERAAKGKEIADAQRKASAEVLKARQDMEATLVSEIKSTVNTIVESQALDLIFDKSFLPKANKAILYTSANVKDLTPEVIASLNANAPAGTVPAPAAPEAP